MAKSKQPSAKMGDTIDGDAVEKPARQTTSPHAGASKDSQTESSLRGPYPSAGSLIALAALALSVFAISLASFAVWQQHQNTADIAALMPISNSDAGKLAGIANPDFVDQLATLKSQLTADRRSQQSALAALQDQIAAP